MFRAEREANRRTVASARVCSHDQTDDLERQKQVLGLHCARQGSPVEVIADLGSGMNYHQQGLKRRLDAVIDGEIGRLVITHKDRLLRFGAERVFAICEAKGVEVVILNPGRGQDVRGRPRQGHAGDHYGVQRPAVRRPLAQEPEAARWRAGRCGECRMLIAYRLALAPNNAQATCLARAAGAARLADNWALAEWKRQYEAWKADNTLPKPWQAALRRQLNAIKREQLPWMLEVTRNAPQMAIIQLGQALQNFFARRAGYPQFRMMGAYDRFTLTNDQFGMDGFRDRRHGNRGPVAVPG